MKKIIRRPPRVWSAIDDEDLRRFHSEGFNDKEIALMMCICVNSLNRRRNFLGLPPNGVWLRPAGWKHTPEARAKITAANYKTWENEEFKARRLPQLEAHGRSLPHKPGPWPQEKRDAFAKRMKERYRTDPEYREHVRKMGDKAREKLAEIPKSPKIRKPRPPSTPESRLFNKLRKVLGVEAARQAMVQL